MYATAAVCSLALVIGFTACDSESGADVCDPVAEPGLRVTVVDGAVAICDAVLVAQDGRYWERLVPVPATASSPCLYEGAFGRPGEYRIEATREGYDNVSAPGLTVSSGACTVATTDYELSLTPERPSSGEP